MNSTTSVRSVPVDRFTSSLPFFFFFLARSPLLHVFNFSKNVFSLSKKMFSTVFSVRYIHDGSNSISAIRRSPRVPATLTTTTTTTTAATSTRKGKTGTVRPQPFLRAAAEAVASVVPRTRHGLPAPARRAPTTRTCR